MDNQYMYIGIVFLFVIGLSLINIMMTIEKNKPPSIVGYSIRDATAIIEASEKPFILGKKIGFVEPPVGKVALLGKIAEQYPIASEDTTLPTQIDYKLYQIDSSRFVESVAVSNIQENKKTIENIKKEMEILKNSSQPIIRPRIQQRHVEIPVQETFEEPVPDLIPNEVFEQQQQEQEDPIQRLMRIPKRERISPPSVAYKRSGNLEFMIPDRESHVKYHVSKESFFW
jgi:hypothetical protein